MTYCCSDSFKESETLQGTNANELKKDALVSNLSEQVKP